MNYDMSLVSLYYIFNWANVQNEVLLNFISLLILQSYIISYKVARNDSSV